MKLGVFAKTFPGQDPHTVLAAARNAGYACVQYNMACSGLGSLPSEIGADAIRLIRAAIAETGIEVAAVSATYNMIHPDRHERERGRCAFRAIATAAAQLGVRVVTVCTGSRDPEDQWRFHPENAGAASWKDLLDEFEALLDDAHQFDVVIGVEPEIANVVNSAQRARQLLDELRDPHIGIVLDAANLFEAVSLEAQRTIVKRAAELLGDSIVLAHAKDRLAGGSFAPAGAGVLDYGHYLAVLRNAGFDGTLIAHGMDANQASGVAAFLKAQLP